MALDPINTATRPPVPRSGRIRRCTVRHVSIIPSPDGRGRVAHVDCLLGGRDHTLPLGSMDEARAICNACTARSVWREDED